MPEKVTFSDGAEVLYTYNAAGEKLQMSISDGGDPAVTDYLNGFQYQNGVLQFVLTSEGYYDFVNSRYVYNYTDHLGNIRLSYYKNSTTATILDENNYYPFGLKHEGYNGKILSKGNTNYQYKYQGQELQTETGWYSFKWRNYDPSIGRFFNIDPLSDKYRDWSPYVFSGNRVVNARELEGLEPYVTNNKDGKMEVDYHAKVITKEGTTTESINNHLAEVSTILSQNEELKINMINDPNATFGIDMTKDNQKYTIITDPVTGEQSFVFIKGSAYPGNPIDQTINSDGTANTTAHEVGHALGLPHIFDVNSTVSNTVENKNNLMNSDANDKPDMKPARGTDLQPSQIDIMKQTIETQQNRLPKIYNNEIEHH